MTKRPQLSAKTLKQLFDDEEVAGICFDGSKSHLEDEVGASTRTLIERAGR